MMFHRLTFGYVSGNDGVFFMVLNGIELKKAPIIVVGMHRSGTTLVTKLLDMGGIFIGPKSGYDKISVNWEAYFFQQLNELLLEKSNATWFEPEQFLTGIQHDEDHKEILVTILQEALRRKMRTRYLYGWQLYFCRILGNLSKLDWGWKDPRNSLTLPVWLTLFPDAKIIHVIRNGVDSAISLYERELRKPQIPVLQSLEYCFRLWVLYTEGARASGRTARYYTELHFEQLLAEPFGVMQTLSEFTGVQFSQTALKKLMKNIDPTRTKRYFQEEYRDFYTQCKTHPLMASVGYIVQ